MHAQVQICVFVCAYTHTHNFFLSDLYQRLPQESSQHLNEIGGSTSTTILIAIIIITHLFIDVQRG